MNHSITAKLFYAALALCCVFSLLSSSNLRGQVLTDDLNGALSFGGSSTTGIAPGTTVSQIAFDPTNPNKVFVSTFADGIWTFDYDPDAANILSNGSKILSHGSLGVALHEDPSIGQVVVYTAPAVPFSANSGTPNLHDQSIVRVTDSNGDGIWGGAGDLNQTIIDNISVNEHHQVNQLKVQGNTLFVNIGTKTALGGVDSPDPGEAARNGTVCFIEDLTQVSTTASNPSAFVYVDLNGDGVVSNLDVRSDAQAFVSLDPTKLRVYSTGFRNNYGMGISPSGELWVAQNSEDTEDELSRAFYQSDRGFAKINNLVGDWRIDGDHDSSALGAVDPSQAAIGAGFFGSSNQTSAHALLGENTSANGLDFLTNTADTTLEGDILITRWSPGIRNPPGSGDIVHVDSVTGTTTIVIEEVENLLDIQADSFGNFLVSDFNGTFTQIRVDTATQVSNVPVTEDGTAFAVAAASFYNETANIIGGSASADIPTFMNLVFFDTTGLTTDSGAPVAAGDISGGALTFTVNNAGGGEHSGSVEVQYLGSIATIPVQDGGNDSPSDQELLALAQTTGTVLFNGPLAVNDSETLDLSGVVDNNSPVLVFRFTDPNPAPAENQQSGIAIDNLDLAISAVLLGDVDMNGAVNFLDITPFIALLASGGFQLEADINDDGLVDFLDITPFIAILSGG